VPTEPMAPPQPGPAPEDWSIPSLPEDVAQEAFKSFASSQCCYSEAPAKNGVITNMEVFNTYRYRLETFTESRSTEWATKPHEGELADFYTQTAPRPWEVQATPPSHFTNHTEEIRVPYTSSIQDCNSCHATGKIQCQQCNGSGFDKECWVCNGSGTKNDESCSHCDGNGKERCTECDQGMKECETCKGKLRVLTYIKLKVTFEDIMKTNIHALETLMTKDTFSSHFQVYPLLGFPNTAIVEASERLVREQQSKYTQNSRILQQRQTVELIPVTKVNYKWKGDSHVYYVYGNENKVSADNYPATCCCVIQ
uniref:Ssu-2 homolog, tandem duplicate 1 n=1 Tax=Mola mola TaxID=94237 RepID=A0A3Q3WR81_MOLML